MRRSRLIACILAIACVAVALRATADPLAGERKTALREAQEGLRDRRWAAAAEALAAVRERYPGSEEAVEAWVLEARALLAAGKAREALESTTAFLAAHGEDAWSGRVRHTAVEACIALGDPAQASERMQRLADAAAAPEARAAIGARHLVLADGDFDGVPTKDDLGREVKKRDVARALASYRQALEVGLLPERALHARERVALCLEETGDAAGSLATWSALVEEDEKAKAPAAAAVAERWRVGRGRAALKAGQADLARTTLAAALERFPQGALRLETLRLLGEERLTPRGGKVDDLAFEEGVSWLARAVREHRDDPRSMQAQRQLAAAFESRGQSEKAAREWAALVDRAPEDAGAPEARDRAAAALAKAGRFDDAIAEWNRFLVAYANHPLWPGVREKVAAAAYEKAASLLARGDTAGAVAAWKQFAEQRPDDRRAPEALAAAGAALAGIKDHEGALTLWRALAGRYAQTPFAPAARLAVARTLEDALGRLEDAVAAYEELVRLHPRTPQAQEARERLARLKGKHLELRMERVQGTAEPATVRVVSRNIEALKVRVYRLGLEEYFRRKGTLEGVEALQLEVVKADMSSEWRLEGYKPFVLTEADRPLPVTEAGAYVVVAGDDDLTATVLTLRSDIECIVKRGAGGDLLVWAFERNGQAPAAGARVLAATEAGVREAGVTGADGVWHGDEPEGFAGRVLVLARGGAAGTDIERGPALGSGFSARAFVSTDRPVYRPGQEVSWRAIHLDVQGQRYAVAPGLKAVARLVDPRGQEVERAEVVAGPLGTFEGRFAIDGEAPLGRWSVRLAIGPREVGAEGAFEVQEFRKPEFTVDVLPARSVVRTGEGIEARIRLAYAFGGPVPGAEVEWTARRQARTFEAPPAEDLSWYVRSASDAADRERAAARQGAEVIARGRGRTDAAGLLAITLAAGDRDEDAEVVISAQAEDVTRRWVQGSGRVAVSRQDHLASVGTDVAVARPRQPVKAEVRTLDALGSPVARNGVLLLQRVRRVPAPLPPGPVPPGGLRDREGGLPRPMVEEETEVTSWPLSTDARGRAELRVEVPEAGRFRLRWRAQDGRGGVVTAARDLEVAGEAEDLSRDARLVSARTLHVEGEEAELLLSTPVGQGRVLLTYEVERVLEHRFVQITGTSTLLRVPLKGEHAPNVTVAAALPGKEGLLTASCDLVVLRRLEVALRFARAEAGPGDEVELEVTTRDASGKPVAAEVGVSVLDAALYEIVPDLTPPILPFFLGDRRGHAVSTASSLGWRTYGTTRATSADLLAEAAARSGDAQEEMARSALRLAREALRAGDMGTAVQQALAAQEADPGSWDARVLLGELRARPDAEKELRKQEYAAEGGEMARRMADGKPAGMPPPAPASAAAPGAPMKDSEDKSNDRNETADDAPAESELAELAGTGGGAGGAFKGRGGRRASQGGGSMGKSLAITPSRNAAFGFTGAMEPGLLAGDAALKFDGGGLADAFAQMQQAAAPLLRSDLRDSALWQPRAVTGSDGTTRIKVRLPDNLTTWRAVGHGVSSTALVGEGRATLVTRKDLLVRVDAPRFLVAGDRVTVPTAVHNHGDAGQAVQVQVAAEGLDAPGEATTLQVGAQSSAVLDREASAAVHGAARVEVSAVGERGGDRTEARLPVLPRGVREVQGTSGLLDTAAGGRQRVALEVPADTVPGTTRLVLMLQPGVDAALLDGVLALDAFPYGCVEQTVHRFLPALEARAALLAIGSPAAAQLARLDEQVRRGAARLRSLQAEDGSFGWFRGKGSLPMTAYGLLGLVGAREAGVGSLEAPIVRAAEALRRLLGQGDEDARALAHLALARAKRLQPDAYATTFRRRNDDLGIAGLSWLALAAKAAGRDFDVEECARLLVARRVEEGTTTSWKGKPQDCFVGSDLEATGLAVRALLEAGVAGPHAERGMAWLLAHRPVGVLTPTKDTAAFVGAAAAWLRTQRVQGFGGTVTVTVDGTERHRLATGKAAPAPSDLRVVLPGSDQLAPGTHVVELALAGEGRLAWALRLEAVRAQDGLPGTEQGLKVERRYLAPEKALMAGETPPARPGYEVLRPAARPKWEPRVLSQVMSGEPVLVRLVLEAPRDLDYVLVEDPLPAGFEVVEASTRGSFDWQERRDARQVFFVSRVPKGTSTLEYVVQATHLGQFTALGTTASALYAPGIHARAAAGRLDVSPRREAAPGGEVAPTPDEVYAEAQRRLSAGDRKGARELLAALRKEQPLTDEVIEQVEAWLLGIAIEEQDAAAIVRAREELLRRNPGRLPGGLDAQRAMAAAYRSVGQHEAALALWRDVVAAGLGLEAGWSQVLAARGREVEGLDALERALRAQPVSNASMRAAFAAAQRWRELRRPEGRGGRPAGKPMDDETIEAFWSITAHGADQPVADPAGYALVEALRRTKDLAGADRAGEAFLRRFPESLFADDTRYFLSETRFRAFEDAPSAATAAAVRSTAAPLVERGRFPQPGGAVSEWSEFRPRALHLLARVAHVQGDLAQAESLYEQAEGIEDAREALAWLRAKGLSLDDTVVQVGVGAVDLPVRYRNLASVELRAYPIDLQVLFAVRKTLEGLHEIDLSGIAPARQWSAPLPPVPGRQAGSTRLPLGLAPDAWGAWLVVAKGGDLEASTLVVKTGLSAELQRVDEKVRVHVRDASGQPVRGAYVAVSDGERIRARGLTDGRGVFEAPGVGGVAFAVASKGDQVALAR